jgi:hypothetical protein
MQEFWIQILQSFLIAGIWIALATLLAEKLGSKAGGAIANLPSTILISLVYVSIVRTPEYAAEAALAAPLGMAINTVFLFTYILMLRYHLVVAAMSALSVWFLLAWIVSQSAQITILYSLGLYFVATLITFYLLEYVFSVKSVGKQKRPFKWWIVAVRTIFAGSVVGTTVAISTFANSFWTGIFSTFPAVMLSSMTILTISQGPKFAQAVGKTMILASINIVIYAILVHLFYATIGVLWGTLLAFVGAALFIWFIKPLLVRMK